MSFPSIASPRSIHDPAATYTLSAKWLRAVSAPDRARSVSIRVYYPASEYTLAP